MMLLRCWHIQQESEFVFYLDCWQENKKVTANSPHQRIWLFERVWRYCDMTFQGLVASPHWASVWNPWWIPGRKRSIKPLRISLDKHAWWIWPVRFFVYNPLIVFEHCEIERRLPAFLVFHLFNLCSHCSSASFAMGIRQLASRVILLKLPNKTSRDPHTLKPFLTRLTPEENEQNDNERNNFFLVSPTPNHLLTTASRIISAYLLLCLWDAHHALDATHATAMALNGTFVKC